MGVKAFIERENKKWFIFIRFLAFHSFAMFTEADVRKSFSGKKGVCCEAQINKNLLIE